MSGAASYVLIVTCEHGGHQTPPPYRQLFAGQNELLKTHRGFDLGALELARRIAAKFNAPLFFSQTTRLLVDLNRSIGHPSLFSEFSRGLVGAQRKMLIEQHYHPYREQVEQALAAVVNSGRSVVHLSVHSFTPVLNGRTRTADIGLLYDPKRPFERRLCDAWSDQLGKLRPELVVRRNYPYRGTADGFTTALRKRFADQVYAGIEVEVNQKWVAVKDWGRVQQTILDCLADALPASECD